MLTCLVNGRIHAPGDVIENGAIVVEDQVIRQVGPRDAISIPQSARILDARGTLVVPGFIDMHIHGVMGADAMKGQALAMAQALPRFGVTGFLPTTVAAPSDELHGALRQIAQAKSASLQGAAILGIHMEGPYLSVRHPGAMEAKYFRPFNWLEFQGFVSASENNVRMMTLAPEVPPALDYLPRLVAMGIVPSIGHSHATFAQVQAAVKAGLRNASHVYNAMRPFHHREAGTVGAVLFSDDITAELIADGVHVDATAMKLLLRVKGAGRIALVSDALPVAGLPVGEYRWAGESVFNDGKVAKLPGDRLAGSVTMLDGGLRHLVELAGVPFPEALACASSVPARLLGLNTGSLEAGKDADVVLLDERFGVLLTMVKGQVVFEV
ncbi:MAG: N-acetylglucosamine-6-phosphate deacetylase [Chloroflexota bacterium]